MQTTATDLSPSKFSKTLILHLSLRKRKSICSNGTSLHRLLPDRDKSGIPLNMLREFPEPQQRQGISKKISNDIGKLQFVGENMLADRKTTNNSLPKIRTKKDAMEKIIAEFKRLPTIKKLEKLPNLLNYIATTLESVKDLGIKLGDVSGNLRKGYGGLFIELEEKSDGGMLEFTHTERVNGMPDATKILEKIFAESQTLTRAH
ncbi:hypothetical protein BGAL_0211g00230 [Botrytis galanthina]|uniref:Uncharacterized protein n=1 Tax=Botrytis galanthina TaxID=278940 RepID=A0A4S8R795_9HELO|nr:hypothetical protein BGAL_0211g00230 [Botrytis galanthina]